MPLVETNASALVGRIGVVVTEVTERAGRIKLAGEVWTARTENDEIVPSGAEVRVTRIAGATAVVTRHLDPIVQDPGSDVPSAPVDPSQGTSS